MRHTLAKLGIPRATFYRWYDRYRRGGPEALNDRSPRPDRIWNRIPDGVRQRIIQLALDEPALSPRELAVRFTDRQPIFGAPIEEVRFARDSPLEGDGFEPSVPRQSALFETAPFELAFPMPREGPRLRISIPPPPSMTFPRKSGHRVTRISPLPAVG